VSYAWLATAESLTMVDIALSLGREEIVYGFA
jgi:hypothetical protein